jgi:hypothetical protein
VFATNPSPLEASIRPQLLGAGGLKMYPLLLQVPQLSLS